MDSMGGMLTNGLGGPACNTLIYGPFHLKCIVTPVQSPPTSAGGGGSHVRPGSAVAGIIQSYPYQRNDVEDDEKEKRDAAIREKRLVTIVVGINKKTIQREYVVDKKRADHIVNAINVVNKTLQSISTSVSTFSRKIANIIIKMKR